MVRDVGDRRPLDPDRGVVPAELAAGRVLRRVEWIAAIEGQVDPPDERDVARRVALDERGLWIQRSNDRSRG